MAFITVGRENTADINLYYEDLGSGPAVVLLSGWPLDSRSWEPQAHALLAAGYRVITYDRRGFGQSSRPTTGYDFDTLAADLSKLLTELDLQDATLIGFSLGTGEVARYIGAYGTSRLKSCVFIESLAPSFGRSEENPNGVDQAAVDTVRQAILDDRPAWLTGLLGDFLNLDDYLGKRVSEETRAQWLERRCRGVAVGDMGVRAHLAGRLPRGHQADRHPGADPARDGRPDPVRRGPGPPDARGPARPRTTSRSRVARTSCASACQGARDSWRSSAAAPPPRPKPPHRNPAQAILDTRASSVLTEIPCGVESGWHIHPGEEVGYILAGTSSPAAP